MELAILGGGLECAEGVCASPGPRAQAPKEQTAWVGYPVTRSHREPVAQPSPLRGEHQQRWRDVSHGSPHQR
jgi:hypothetical protein